MFNLDILLLNLTKWPVGMGKCFDRAMLIYRYKAITAYSENLIYLIAFGKCKNQNHHSLIK